MERETRSTERASRAPFLVRTDGEARTVHPIPAGMTRVGRSSKNDLCLRESSVSRFHCCLLNENGRVKVFDTRSRNRTRIDGRIASGQYLRDGDTLQLGRCSLEYHAPPPRRAERPTPTGGGPVLARRLEYRRRRERRSRSWDLLPLGIILVLGGTGVGLFHVAGGFRRAGDGSDPAVDSGLSPGAGLSDSQTDRFRELDGLIEEQDRQIRLLQEQLKSAPSSGTATVAAANGADRDEWIAHWRSELERREAERKKLADQLREVLAGSGVAEVEALPDDDAARVAGAGLGESAPEDSPSPPGERGRTRVDGVPEPEVVRKLSNREIHERVEALKQALGRYAEYGVDAGILEPHLGELAASPGEKAVQGLVDVLRYGHVLLEDVEKNVSFLKKRNEKLLEEAKRIRTDGKQLSHAELEKQQRLLDLSEKKIAIQEGHLGSIFLLRTAVAEALLGLRDEESTRALAARFALGSDGTFIKLAILKALELAGARHSIPLLIPKLRHRDPQVAGAVHRTLVALTGVDLGKDRGPWDAYARNNNNGGENKSK